MGDVIAERRKERPTLEFSEYGVAGHFVVECGTHWKELPEPSDAFDSFERDILAYAYRAAPPFRTTPIELPETLSTVTVRFPPKLVFRSENREVTLHRDSTSPRRRSFSLKASRTDFLETDLSVLHVVLGPTDASHSKLDEYDLIKLAKVWEGGEVRERGERFEPGEPQGWLGFETDDGDVPFLSLADRIVGEARLRERTFDRRLRTYRVGTIQLLTEGLEYGDRQPIRDLAQRPLWKEIAALVDDAGQFESHAEAQGGAGDLRWRRLRAAGGIVQGLLDFETIDASELSEVFDEFRIEDEAVLGFHKGTLFYMAPEERAWTVTRDTIGVSPYLLVPHAVVLFNEERLKEARQAGSTVAQQSTKRLLSKGAYDAVKNARSSMASILSRDFLPNVFHYPQERWLYERGHESRGLTSLKEEVGGRLEDASIDLEDRASARRNVGTFVIGLLLALVGAAQAGQFMPDEVILALIAVLGVVYFLWLWLS